MKLLFVGTSSFARTVLESLLASSHPVMGVVTAPRRRRGRGQALLPTDVGSLAEERSLPLLEPEDWGPGTLAWVAGLGADRLVVADYGRKLPTALLPPALNVHPSLLPRWRGAAPVARAIMAGDLETGVSIMTLVERMDAGPVYRQEKEPIQDDDTTGALTERLARKGGHLLVGVLDEVQSGRDEPLPQDERLATKAPKIGPEEEWVDPTADTVEGARKRVRALSPHPGTRIRLDGKDLTLVALGQPTGKLPPGALGEEEGSLILGLADGSVEVLLLRPAGGREMTGKAYLNGLRGRGRF